MAFCNMCGSEIKDGELSCPKCGAPVQQQNSQNFNQANNQSVGQTTNQFTDKVAALNNTADFTAQYNPEDIQNSTLMGVLSYLSILVLIPIFAAKNSPYTRFHANQGLTLFIIDVIWGVVSTIIRFVFGFTVFKLLSGLVSLAIFVLAVIGIINVVNGKAKQLPIIGTIQILK